jgi:hypothetical protein
MDLLSKNQRVGALIIFAVVLLVALYRWVR